MALYPYRQGITETHAQLVIYARRLGGGHPAIGDIASLFVSIQTRQPIQAQLIQCLNKDLILKTNLFSLKEDTKTKTESQSLRLFIEPLATSRLF